MANQSLTTTTISKRQTSAPIMAQIVLALAIVVTGCTSISVASDTTIPAAPSTTAAPPTTPPTAAPSTTSPTTAEPATTVTAAPATTTEDVDNPFLAPDRGLRIWPVELTGPCDELGGTAVPDLTQPICYTPGSPLVESSSVTSVKASTSEPWVVVVGFDEEGARLLNNMASVLFPAEGTIAIEVAGEVHFAGQVQSPEFPDGEVQLSGRSQAEIEALAEAIG